LLPTLIGVFPKWQEGRHPHCHFRGLLKLHSRYGPSADFIASYIALLITMVVAVSVVRGEKDK